MSHDPTVVLIPSAKQEHVALKSKFLNFFLKCSSLNIFTVMCFHKKLSGVMILSKNKREMVETSELFLRSYLASFHKSLHLKSWK